MANDAVPLPPILINHGYLYAWRDGTPLPDEEAAPSEVAAVAPFSSGARPALPDGPRLPPSIFRAE